MLRNVSSHFVTHSNGMTFRGMIIFYSNFVLLNKWMFNPFIGQMWQRLLEVLAKALLAVTWPRPSWPKLKAYTRIL